MPHRFEGAVASIAAARRRNACSARLELAAGFAPAPATARYTAAAAAVTPRWSSAPAAGASAATSAARREATALNRAGSAREVTSATVTSSDATPTSKRRSRSSSRDSRSIAGNGRARREVRPEGRARGAPAASSSARRRRGKYGATTAKVLIDERDDAGGAGITSVSSETVTVPANTLHQDLTSPRSRHMGDAPSRPAQAPPGAPTVGGSTLDEALRQIEEDRARAMRPPPPPPGVRGPPEFELAAIESDAQMAARLQAEEDAAARFSGSPAPSAPPPRVTAPAYYPRPERGSPRAPPGRWSIPRGHPGRLPAPRRRGPVPPSLPSPDADAAPAARLQAEENRSSRAPRARPPRAVIVIARRRKRTTSRSRGGSRRKKTPRSQKPRGSVPRPGRPPLAPPPPPRV